MIRTVSLGLFLCLAGCAAPRIRATVPGSGACVLAEGDEGRRIAEIIEHYEAAVIEILGTRWEGPYEVRVSGEELAFHSGAHTLTYTPWFACLPWGKCTVVLGPEAPRGNLEKTMLHELVHVHGQGSWSELPLVVQEGVADWVALVVLDKVKNYRPRAPDPELLLAVLTMSNDEWLSLDLEERRELNRASYWVAAHLFEGTSSTSNVSEGTHRIPLTR